MAFNNIFGDNEEIKIKEITVIIDYRESQERINLVKKYCSCEVVVEKLDIGDYLIGDICIEYKSAKDFVNSILTKRIWNQLVNISQYPLAAIFIGGDMNEALLFHKNPMSIIPILDGVIATILIKFPNISLVMVDSDKRFAHIIEKLVNQTSRKGLKPIKMQKRGKDISAIRQQILCCIPSIGRKKAIEILEQTTIKDFIEMPAKEMGKLNKVGKKTYIIIKELFFEK